MLEISLLGPLEVRADGETVDIPGEVARRLLATLATEGPVTPERLVDVLWGEDLPRSPKAALQTQISRLRSRLGDRVAINTGVGYELSDAAIDIDRFQALASSGDPTDLEEAVTLIRGRPLADLAGCSGLDGTRRALDELTRGVRVRCAEARIDAGRAEATIPDLEKLTGEAPLYEPAWAALALANHAAGRQAAALEVIDRYRSHMADAGLDASARMLEVEEQIFAEQPPAPTGTGRPSSLRAVRTEVIGRELEAASLQALLRRERVVTLIGAGGMGKTTLAEMACRKISDEFAGGVIEVELVGDLDPTEVASTIARGLGVRWSGDPIEAVAASIGNRRTLLLLDNCEHITAAVASVIDRLCGITEHVAIIATSREPLGSPHEHVFRIGSLDVRAATDLFERRAMAAGADLRTEDRQAIEELCERLDGMPLAIEMAAARARSLTPGELLAIVETDEQMLEARGAQDRHRSLDALVQWSYRLLDVDEQRAFRGLGVFVGPFEAADAAAVLDRPLVQATILLGRLVDRSLLTSRRRGSVTVFRMLTTLRTSAVRLADAADERQRLEHAHAEWISELTASVSDFPDRPEQRTLLARLEDAVPDVLEAHRRAVAAGDLDLQSRLIGPLFSYAYLSLPPGIAEAAEATVSSMTEVRTSMDAWVCAVDAAYLIAAGQPERADSILRFARESDAGSRAIPVWVITADLALYRGELAAAQAAGSRVTELVGDDDSLPAGGWTDGRLLTAMAAAYSGRADEAAALTEDGLANALEHGGSAYIALAEFTMGEVRQYVQPEVALTYIDRALDDAIRHGIDFVEGIARVTRASILARSGRHADALFEFGELIDRLERTGARIHLWTAIRNVIILLGDMGRYADAAFLLGATDDRVAPTFGEEQAALEVVAEEGRRELDGFDVRYQEGRRTPVHDVASAARAIVDAAG